MKSFGAHLLLVMTVLSMFSTIDSPLLATPLGSLNLCESRLKYIHSGPAVPFSQLPTELQLLLISEHKENCTFSILSDRGTTGVPYLVEDPQGGTQLVYKYFLDEKSRVLVDPSRPPQVIKKMDEIAFDEMDDAIAAGIDLGFEVAKTYPTQNPRILKVEYSPWPSLATLLESSAFSPKVRSELIRRYEVQLNTFLKNFMPRVQIEVAHSSITSPVKYDAIVRSRRGEFRVHLKPDNITVDLNTFKMKVIDPN